MGEGRATGGMLPAGLPLPIESGCILPVPRHRPTFTLTVPLQPPDPDVIARTLLAALSRIP